MAPGRRSEIYRLAVGLAAAALFTATFSLLAGVAVDGWVIATLAAGGLLALRFPLHVSLSEKISVAAAVFFAAVLLLPVAQAAALVAAISGVDIAIAATRSSRIVKARSGSRASGGGPRASGRRRYSRRRNQPRAGRVCGDRRRGRLLCHQPRPRRDRRRVRHVAQPPRDHAHDAEGRPRPVRDPVPDRRHRGVCSGPVAVVAGSHSGTSCPGLPLVAPAHRDPPRRDAGDGAHGRRGRPS